MLLIFNINYYLIIFLGMYIPVSCILLLLDSEIDSVIKFIL